MLPQTRGGPTTAIPADTPTSTPAHALARDQSVGASDGWHAEAANLAHQIQPTARRRRSPGGVRSSPPRIRYASTQPRHTSNPEQQRLPSRRVGAAIGPASWTRTQPQARCLSGRTPPPWAGRATTDKAASIRPTPSPLAVRATRQLAPAAARQRDGEGGELAAARVTRGRSRGRPRRRATHGDLGGRARPDPLEGDEDAPPPPSPQAAGPSGGQLRQRRGRERPTKGRWRLLGIMGSVRVTRRGGNQDAAFPVKL
ncbi:hypothetical protein ZEAMMB73_Zm00001d040088 [Zea mays]|jgi:hypothetical protein|uniref:Uncharacterized protein n=1 Tax=Zea mays TaxID=4577 RepID=A0A1D6MN20_MAIZE|nr:hypothetical protein ZEAMMB73_Zm00001d040088 [Zea mays]